MSYRKTHMYSFVKKIKENLPEEEIAFLMEAIKTDELDEMVEFEKYFNIALSAFNRAKSDIGWGQNALKAPPEQEDKTPMIQKSKWLETQEDIDKKLSLGDESGDIVVVEMSKTGTVKGLLFQ